jgi:hypothetical protein
MRKWFILLQIALTFLSIDSIFPQDHPSHTRAHCIHRALKKNYPEPMQRFVRSDDNLFVVYFDTSGAFGIAMTDADDNGIPDYADYVLEGLTDSYSLLIDSLGHPKPPEGSDWPGAIPVYLTGTTGYGQTWLIDQVNLDEQRARFAGYIEINARMQNTVPVAGIPQALRSTAAHEFYHVVQIGMGIWLDFDLWLLESTATAVEGVLFGLPEGYLGYVQSLQQAPFRNGLTSNSAGSSYGHYLFWEYLHKKTGQLNFFKEVFEAQLSNTAENALIKVVEEQEIEFPLALSEFALWRFRTGANAVAGGFNGAASMPMLASMPLVTSSSVDESNITNWGFRLYHFDEIGSVEISTLRSSFSIWSPAGDFTGFFPANEPLLLSGGNESLVFVWDGNIPFRIPGNEKDLIVYPNPFVAGYHPAVNISPVEAGHGIRIYNVLGQEVYRTKVILEGTFQWFGQGKTGSLASGMYFIKVTETGQEAKCVILR